MDKKELQKSEENKPLLSKPIRSKRKEKQLKAYYDNQVEFLACHYRDRDQVSDIGTERRSEFYEKERKQRQRDSLLAKITFFLNLILLLVKVVAAYLSGSLAVISSVIESAVDITSGATVWLTLRAIESADPFEYPRGRAKLEPLAIVVVSIIMGVASILVIIISIETVLEDRVNPTVELPTLIILLSAILSKSVLMIFCLRERSANSQLLALDQRNDVITNTVALMCAWIGDHFWKYADPIGAITVSLVVSLVWFYVAWQQIPIMSGKRASPQHINRIIALCYEHQPPIDYLDDVVVYHYTDKLLVDIRIVLPSKTPLERAVEVSSTLQEKLQCLPYVHRAFVSLVCHTKDQRRRTVPDLVAYEANVL